MEISSFEKTKVGGVEARGNFRMKASAKAFRILSDGLYQNKIAAVIRELGTNAHDSHVAAGKAQVPFLVHVPSQAEPWFSVRDFGIGMAPEVLEELYVTYFDSTKTSSNDFTGCLGLGSKSPFSYSDNFTIISVWEGEKRVYLARLDSEGMPCIDLVSKAETTEEIGIEVRVNITNKTEIPTWRGNIKNIYCHFDVIPNLNDVQLGAAFRDEIVEMNRDLKSELVGIRDGIEVYSIRPARDHSLGNQSHVVMGNVSYPFPRAADFYNENAEEIQKQILNLANWYVKVPIGFFDIAASRESLSIDVNTKKNLQKVTILIRDLLVEKIQKDIKGVTTVYEGIKTLDDIKKKYPAVNLSNKNLFPLEFKVDGKDIQKCWYEAPRINKLAENTINPKTFQISVTVKLPKSEIIARSDEEIKEFFEKVVDEKLKKNVYKGNKISYRFIEDRIGETVTSSSFSSYLVLSKNAIVVIDGEKPLVYSRPIEEFLFDKAREEMLANADKFASIYRKELTVPGGYGVEFAFNLRAIVIRAYEIPNTLELPCAQKFIEDAYLDDSDGVYFVSDFLDQYKAERKKGSKASGPKLPKNKKTEWSLKTYKLVPTGVVSQIEYFESIELKEDDSDQEYLYTDRSGMAWSVPGFYETLNVGMYHKPATVNLFNFLRSKKISTEILSLTETQKTALEKRGFNISPVKDTIVDLVAEEFEELEKEDVEKFFDLVETSHTFTQWLRAFEKAKNSKNEEYVDWIIGKFLVSQSSVQSKFDRKIAERFSALRNLLSTFNHPSGSSAAQVFQSRINNLGSKIEKERLKAQNLINGEKLVSDMIKNNPILELFNLYKISYDANYYQDEKNQFKKTLEYLQTIEAHKK